MSSGVVIEYNGRYIIICTVLYRTLRSSQCTNCITKSFQN